jgi:hypothetical protein
MYLKKILNFNFLIISILSLFLLINLTSRLEASAEEEQATMYQQYDIFDTYAMIETTKEAMKITGQLLDLAKEYGIEPEQEFRISPEDFIGKENQDISSISKLAAIVPREANMSNTIVQDIKERLEKVYTDSLNQTKSAFNNSSLENTNSGLANKNNLEPFLKLSGEKIDSTKTFYNSKKEDNISFTKNTDSVKDLKMNMPKLPKTPPPTPTSTPDCLSAKLQSEGAPADDQTKDIAKAPALLEPSGDYFEDTLLRASLTKDKNARNDLRKAYTEILQGTIEKSLSGYYQKLKLKKESELSAKEALTQRTETLEAENQVVRDVLAAFTFYRNLTDLEMRYEYEKKALMNVDKVLNQIKELHGIEKDAVKSMSNLPPAV